VPQLQVPTLQGESFDLHASKPQTFDLLVFYRGYHCPVCKAYLRDLDRKIEEFTQRGVEVIVLSANDQQLAQQSRDEWGLRNLRIGYELPLNKAREWGLYISEGINEQEPAQFSEPGLFMVNPDNTLYAAAIQTMPFARPNFGELLQAIDFVTQHQYPARGEA
jgi:alkyl hydroperoxide reductase subunit AhpC